MIVFLSDNDALKRAKVNTNSDFSIYRFKSPNKDTHA